MASTPPARRTPDTEGDFTDLGFVSEVDNKLKNSRILDTSKPLSDEEHEAAAASAPTLLIYTKRHNEFTTVDVDVFGDYTGINPDGAQIGRLRPGIIEAGAVGAPSSEISNVEVTAM